MLRVISLITGIAVAMATAVQVPAQDDLDRAAMARQMRRNQEELRRYSWQSISTYHVNGVQRRQDVYRIQYDSQGMLVKVQQSGTAVKDKLRGADGKKLKKEQLEEAYLFAVDVRSQLIGYLNPMLAEKAVQKAEVTPEGETLRLRSAGVVAAGDVVEITLDRATHLPLSLKADSTIGDAPVTLEVRFEAADFGPYYPVHSVTRSTWRGLELIITTDDSDYVKK
jgi:hypothetical protein